MAVYFRFPNTEAFSVAVNIVAESNIIRSEDGSARTGWHIWIKDVLDAQKFAGLLIADGRVAFVVSPFRPKEIDL